MPSTRKTGFLACWGKASAEGACIRKNSLTVWLHGGSFAQAQEDGAGEGGESQIQAEVPRRANPDIYDIYYNIDKRPPSCYTIQR
jgi:hypothetical protein